MSFLKPLQAQLAQILPLYGAWGLFAIAFLDSSVVSLPGFSDVVLIYLSGRSPARTPLYVLATTLGSVAGSFVLYGLARGGRKLFRRQFTPSETGSAQRWLRRNDVVSVAVVSMLPPPAPFKAFLFTAGLLRVNPLRFAAGLLLGRGARFAAVGYLGARYGMRAEAYLRENVVWFSLLLVLVVVLAAVVRGWYRRRIDRLVTPEVPTDPSHTG